MTTPTAFAFTPIELWTLGIAAYAAVVSTFVLGWDAYKWLASGAKIELTAQSGMKTFGGTVVDPMTYIAITAWNVGDQPTTIANLGGVYFESWWQAYVRRRKPVKSFIINEPSQAQRLPYRFEVGDQWIGMGVQTDEILQQAKNGYLFLIVYTARGGRGTRVRLKVPPKETKANANT